MAPSPPPVPGDRDTPPVGADPRAPDLPAPPEERGAGAVTGGVLASWRRWEDVAASRGIDTRLPLWVLGGLVVAVVGWWSLRPAPTPVEETIPVASTEAAAERSPAAAAPSSATDPAAGAVAGDPTSTVPETVVAHAAGAVTAPGVYALDGGARIDDLVTAAGGLAPDADPSRVNLAAPLADGAWVYVPRVGEEVPPGPSAPVGPPAADGEPPGAAGPGTSDADPPDALIDLNAADAAELDELPGVGPAIAAAIVAHREEVGGFTSVDELLDVRGIGEAKLEDIRPLVTV